MIFLGPGTYAIWYPKDVVFAEILIFSNIFGFPTVNLDPKCTKTVNFGHIPFRPKCKILKDFSNSICLIGDNLWSKFQQDQTMFGEVRAQKPPKMGNFMDAETIQKFLKIYNFATTNAFLMKVTTNVYLKKMFHFAKSWGVTHRVPEGVNKNPLKMSQKINFLAQF